MRIIAGIDAGTKESGLCVVQNGKIAYADNLPNAEVFDAICVWVNKGDVTVVIEDVKPYAVEMGKQIIDTIKFIGVLQYRLDEAGIRHTAIFRWDVKVWCFKYFPSLVLPRIEQKIIAAEKRKKKEFEALIEELDIEDAEYESKKKKLQKKANWYRKSDGTLKSATPHYVGDREVIVVMKEHWQIPTPKGGKKNIYNLRDHSWQALICATLYMIENKIPQHPIHRVPLTLT
jgi:hypothetical protein